MKLAYKNCGYFDDSCGEFVITQMYPKRPLINYLWNEQTVAHCDQFGFGKSMSADEKKPRPMDAGERLLYLKDNTDGNFYSPNRNYARLPFDTFECHVGQGYQRIVSEYGGLRTEFTLLVPKEGRRILYRAEVTEMQGKNRDLNLYFVIRPQANLTEHTSYGYADCEDKRGLYFPHVAYQSPSEYGFLYFASERRFSSYALSKNDFCGTYGSWESPDGIEAKKLCSKGTTFEDDYVAAVSFPLKLRGKEQKSFTFSLAAGKTLQECREAAQSGANGKVFARELRAQAQMFCGQGRVFRAQMPDPLLCSLSNVWLKRQLSLGKTWGRIYGKGFRDVMQDIAAFVSLDIPLARERILKTLSKQYASGNTIRMFEPDLLLPYNDGASWIPATVSAYLKESGDFSLLEERVAFLDGGEDTVYGHVMRGVEYLLNDLGVHGLVLLRGGDWNDSLNGAGNLGRGEGIWLSLATVKAAKEFAQIARYVSRGEDAERVLDKAKKLEENILRFGLDEDSFLYAYDDWGGKIGAAECEEGNFYLNPQTWAVLAQVGSAQLRESVMEQVEKRLRCAYGYKLCDPPYTKGDDRLGRVSYFVPGMVENAAVYLHGVMFKIAADCMLGKGDRAYDTLRLVLFSNPAVQASGVEPYAVSNMYIGPENPYRAGEAPMSWITGSAGWLYRNITEGIFGIRAEFEGLTVSPCFPSHWESAQAERVFRGTLYRFFYKKTGKNKIVADGKIVDGVLPAGTGNRVVRVEVEY